MDSNKLLPISVFLLSVSILFGSVWIGHKIEKSANLKNLSSSISIGTNTFNISQAASYLNMSIEELQGIINAEKNYQSTHGGSFYGKMFPYFIIDNNYYFYKGEIDEWLKEVSNLHREYNTNNKTMY